MKTIYKVVKITSDKVDYESGYYINFEEQTLLASFDEELCQKVVDELDEEIAKARKFFNEGLHKMNGYRLEYEFNKRFCFTQHEYLNYLKFDYVEVPFVESCEDYQESRELIRASGFVSSMYV